MCLLLDQISMSKLFIIAGMDDLHIDIDMMVDVKIFFIITFDIISVMIMIIFRL